MTSIYPSSNTSATNSSTSSANLLRISGMASGIDTDSVVKSMVSSYQTKIDKANQEKQLVQWKQEAYRDIIKDVKGLQEYFDPLSSKYILSGKSLNINSAASDDNSVVSATAVSTAKAGTYKVSVSKLATQASIDGTYKDSILTASSLQGKDLKFTVNSGSIPIDLGTVTGNTTVELVSNINSAIAKSSLNGKITASYVKEGNTEYVKFTQDSSDTDKIQLLTANNSYLSKDVTINGGISSASKLMSDLSFTKGNASFKLTSGNNDFTVSLNVDENTTMQNLADAVNSATSGAITMNIDDNTGKISFQSKSYGSSSNISITNISTSKSNVINNLGISDSAGTSDKIIGTAGIDAMVSITEPGQTTETTTTQSSNKFTINGVSYNIVSTDSANVTVTANSDTVVTNMKNFITDYNAVISKINTKLTEKKNSDYPPLTDAQKESMSDTQITAWETKAKVGILRNDDNLSQLMTQLRGIFSSPVYSSYNSSDTSTGKISLSFGQYGSNAIGIDTSTDVTDGGQLVIKDETKLKDAIENNLDDFKKLFIGSSDSKLGTNESYVGSEKYKEDGIFKRMDTILRDYVAAPGVGEDGTYTLSGSMNIFVNKQYDYSTTGSGGKNTLPDQVYNETLSISRLKTQMSDAENRYYKKFTALETALSNLNSQQSTLSSLLGTS
ncbi:flagellar filament capping protein FliD [Clostridium beijerinckii]|uniref:flagellar filament capping protein FliD n=1 Tax=Clostridium beijerinckii TaxID=1520 RepID=UPI001360D644|nr:flagellar filament capping protein FliD [Clostridium beijerinckii]MZK49891.1 flagellar filament capping protein FliD [Clostridium beijerinckii]MZK57850.1 flagellar filament capping protein FliD [Clostridium beijerinckii]MZK68061.1 flagellar filament capping protein FliD [Clostridium beijerinckii]MZK73559.1 flagellar filament capping protein FliD [Clostridium beijerinckii]MZK83141.1 flagellar filament capping protein FliD [Clostridium beijerinckii]